MAHSEALFDAISIPDGLAGSAGMDWAADGAGFWGGDGDDDVTGNFGFAEVAGLDEEDGVEPPTLSRYIRIFLWL